MKLINVYLLSLLIFVGIGNTSCGDGDSANETDSTSTVENIDSTQVDLVAGGQVYTNFCVTCHQLNGEGVAGTFPPLANADYLLADKMRAVKQTIYGSDHPITVNGIEYPGGIMTKDLGLTDEQTRDVVNYILNSWGNNGGTVTLEDVQKARK